MNQDERHLAEPMKIDATLDNCKLQWRDLFENMTDEIIVADNKDTMMSPTSNDEPF